ncbi:hypothetical protein, partial [Desulfatibacillum aliphaticivorans]|uniref:hypothetical protein n=1 Tax=Desulfatibacillum aliphaticivorans TaxID=218208 RepID=UPI00055383C4
MSCNSEDDCTKYVFDAGFIATFLNHVGKIILVTWCALAGFEVVCNIIHYGGFSKVLPYVSLTVIPFAFIPLYLFSKVGLRKVVYKLIYDVAAENVIFWIFYKKEPICVTPANIDNIRLGMYVYFELVDGQIYVGWNNEKRFVNFLRKNEIEFKWGKLGSK